MKRFLFFIALCVSFGIGLCNAQTHIPSFKVLGVHFNGNVRTYIHNLKEHHRTGPNSARFGDDYAYLKTELAGESTPTMIYFTPYSELVYRIEFKKDYGTEDKANLRFQTLRRLLTKKYGIHSQSSEGQKTLEWCISQSGTVVGGVRLTIDDSDEYGAQRCQAPEDVLPETTVTLEYYYTQDSDPRYSMDL